MTSESPFLTDSEQQRLSNSRVLVAGCGVGSWTAEFLVKAGIGTVILADPGNVSDRNIGRQNYSRGDFGKKKVEALARRIMNAGYPTGILLFNDGVTEGNVDSLVNNCDVIVDAIDISCPGIELLLHQRASARKISVVTGFDIGYGARTYLFDYRNPGGLTLQRFLGIPNGIGVDAVNSLPFLAITAQVLLGPIETACQDTNEMRSYYDSLIDRRMVDILSQLPPEMQTIARNLRQGSLKFVPQTLEAATIHGAMQAKIIKDVILGHPVKVVPEFSEINLQRSIR